VTVINGLDILVLLKVVALSEMNIPSKTLAEALFVEPSEITRSWKRTRVAGLSYSFNHEQRVNRAGLLELLIHGLRYVFPSERGAITRGIPTGIAAEPLKSQFIDAMSEAPVWPYAEGQMRGYSIKPLHRQVPRAALEDPKLYELLALVDAARGDRVRERTLAGEELTKRLMQDA
jgi:hypothetical protein